MLLLRWVMCCLLFFPFTFLQGEDQLFCPFDDRTWKVGYEGQNGEERITELILNNETINLWNELFTVQAFEAISFSASDFVTILERAGRKNLSPNESLQFKVIEKDPLNIVETSFIYQGEQNPLTITNDEYNIARIIKGKTTLYYLRYSTKDAQLFKQNKEIWIQRFKQAYVDATPKKDQSPFKESFGKYHSQFPNSHLI